MQAEIERVLALSEELLAVPSAYGAEAELCERLALRLGARGMHEVLRADDSLCVVPAPLRDGVPRLVLCGHLDTVPELSPNPVRREGGRLYGLGASDMQAAVAAIVWALERAAGEVPALDVVGLLYAREEGPYASSAMPAILQVAGSRVAGADLVVCMEPTDGRIEVGCMGAAQVRVSFSGQRAHSARPWLGDNAIHKAGPLLTRLAALAPRVVEIGGLDWIEVVSATTASFRGALNVVPDRFELGLNLRFAPGRTREEVEGEIAALVGSEASFAIEAWWPAGSVIADHPLVDALRAACGGVEIASKQAWTDVGRLSELGIVAINWGPGATSQAHREGEWVEVAQVAACVTALGRWLWPG